VSAFVADRPYRQDGDAQSVFRRGHLRRQRHHIVGCGNARTIVAINTDPAAAIFKEATFGIVGDHRKVVPALASAVLALEPNP
jgi:hypothetical protein